jgi:hypothetical protein
MGPKLAEMDAVLQRLHLSLTQDAVRAGTRTLLVLVRSHPTRGLGRRQLRESGAASRQLVASKDTPSLLVLVRGLGRRQLRESGAASRQLVASKDTPSLLVLVRGLGRRQLRESGAASRQLVASKDTPSLACNRHVPCPTQRTHAMRLWVARTQHGTVCPPF